MRHLFAFASRIIQVMICLGIILLAGCGRKSSETASPPSPSPAAGTATAVSAEKTSFKEVAALLDPGGSFYLYLGTEQWVDGLSGKISDWRGFLDAIPGIEPADRRSISKAFDAVTQLIKDSGIEDVSGVGVSSIAVEPGFYRSKTILHHYPGKGSGFLWTMLGRKSHALDSLDFLPQNTALAASSDLDLALLWSVIAKAVRATDIPKAEEAFDQLPAAFEKGTGLNWEKLLASLGGEYGLVLTLDDARKVSVPLPVAGPLDIPEPGLMLIMKVSDDTIFNRVDAALKDAPMEVIRVDRPDLKMRTMTVPLPLPLAFRPTLASAGGYLFLASNDRLVEDALAVKGGKKPGLKSTEEFKRLDRGIPEKGNQFAFVSQRFGQAFMDLQQRAMAGNTDIPEGQKDLLKKFLNPGQAAMSYAVGANTDDGWLTVGNGNQDSSKTILAAGVVAPVALLAAIAVPNFVRARDTAQKNACIHNLRMIDGAKQQWALETKQKETSMPGRADLQPYLGSAVFPACPAGGRYTISEVSEAPACSVAGHKLPEK